MKNQNYRESTVQATVLSFILSFFIFSSGVLIEMMNETNSLLNLSNILHTIISKPYLWIFGLLVFIITIGVYFIYSRFNTKLSKKDTLIELEYSKTRKVTDYILKLIKEDFKSEYIIEDEHDKLGKSLIELRDTLKTDKEISGKHRKEDEIRNWNAEGLARFGEILRQDNNEINTLAYNVIKYLTDYTRGIQGGFYLLQGDKTDSKYFDLIAFYAYGRKKYSDKHLDWDKGLIGTSAVEHRTIYITELPDSYISVTSGLGKSNPRCLIVTPLVANGELFGVFELASLNTLEPHEIRFIERVAESTASTLSAVKLNMQTARLLEESNAQAQVMTSQEEEMRQNLEELQATQEEAARQAERFMRLDTTVNHTMIRAEYDMQGILLYANTQFLKKLEYGSNSQVEGKPISIFIAKKDEEWFNRIWTNLSEGGRHFEGYMKHITKTGKDLWTIATYTCIRDENGDVERILFLALDTTEQKKVSLNLEGIIDAVNRSGVKVEFDINGNIRDSNESFLYLFKYSEKESKKLTVFDLIDPLELEIFNKKWENIISGMNFQGQFKVKTKTNDEKWIRGSFSAVYDMYGEVDKVIYIGSDTTHEKLIEIEWKKQNEQLKQQEIQLKESEKNLNRKLKEARLDMQLQFQEIEKIKIRNEIMLEGALDAVITTSYDNKIIYCNQASVKLLGYKKEELINKNIRMLFNDQSIDGNEFLSKYVGPGDDKIIGKRKEVKMKLKNGNEIQVSIFLSKAQVDKENTYTAFIEVFK